MTTTLASTSHSPAAAYATKDQSYFSGARVDFVSLLPSDPNAAVLEVGCGTGATGMLALKSGRAGRYVGVELVEDAAEQARTVLDDVIVGDVEVMDLDFQPASFDVLILSEVLEHLREPKDVLRKLHRFVRPGGLVLASSPNISHWRVIAKLIGGHFPQADRGVFDRTHLRWFTPETFVNLFDEAGFPVFWAGPVTPFSSRTRLISRVTGGRFDHLFMTQICVAARRSGL